MEEREEERVGDGEVWTRERRREESGGERRRGEEESEGEQRREEGRLRRAD